MQDEESTEKYMLSQNDRTQVQSVCSEMEEAETEDKYSLSHYDRTQVHTQEVQRNKVYKYKYKQQ
jgi:hypothetical protein